MAKNKIWFPAEWDEQEEIILSWPHPATDWLPMLDEAENCYTQIAAVIARHQKVLIVSPTPKTVERRLKHIEGFDNIRFAETPTNDTWVRDYGPLTIFVNGERRLADFTFNGWGMKFAACLDNQVTTRLISRRHLNAPMVDNKDFVLEGGSVDTDGKGTILTTSSCLLSCNRNTPNNREAIERQLKNRLGAQRVLWLDHGSLPGDDTDGHIDMLARFANENTILYTACRDKNNLPLFNELKLMEEELQAFRNTTGEPYRLVPLYIPRPILNEDNEMMPASYANFLITNHSVIVPVYGDERSDNEALATIAQEFPMRKVVGINCHALIKQGGSLHCSTMQIASQKAFKNNNINP